MAAEVRALSEVLRASLMRKWQRHERSRQGRAFGASIGICDRPARRALGHDGAFGLAELVTLAAAIGALGLSATVVLLAGPPSSAAAQADPCANPDFRTGASAHLPDCRAYEMVSPLDKNGGNVDRDDQASGAGLKQQTGAAPSGDAVAFTSRVQFADIESGTLFPNYVARRGATGWLTEGISPPIGDTFPAAAGPGVMGLSLDLSKAFVTSSNPLTPEGQLLNGSVGLYMRSSDQAERYTLLSRPPAELEQSATGTPLPFEYAAATPDARHVLFDADRLLLPDVPPPSPARKIAVYEWVDGSVRLASVLPPGESLADNSFNNVVVGGGTRSILAGNLPGDHPISDDGRRVFFTAPLVDDAGVGRPTLLVREDGAVTRVVSRSERPGDPFPAGEARFWAARKSDGSVAIFTHSDPLTEDAAPQSLYRWDANTEGQQLTELAHDTSGAPNARMVGPAAVSDDATSVYFVASGVLAESGPGGAPTPGQPNLYLWRQGEGVRYIATLDGPAPGSSRDVMMWDLTWRRGGRAARVSADGERLLFASFAQLDPSYDITEATPEACGSLTAGGQRCRQIYLYDARSDRISCLTCVPGAALTGDANLYGNSEVRGGGVEGAPVNAPLRLPSNLSADGKRAFFETPRRLVPQDNNSALDVYAWVDEDLDGAGELHLVSSGQSATRSQFLAATPAGNDVFFTTRDRLVGIDTDNQIDLYDARVGGGIPAQNPPPPQPCQGDECQGAPSSPPRASEPPSSALVVPGNPEAERGKARRCTKLERRAKNAKRKAKRLRRKAKRASGERAKRLRMKTRRARKKAKRLTKRANRCERRDRQ